MHLKKKLVIVGLTLAAFAPLAAQADGPTNPLPDNGSLFQTKLIGYDYHFGKSKTSVYRSDNAGDVDALTHFLDSNPCLALAADGAKKAVMGIQTSQPYLAALKAYRNRCGTDTSTDPIFDISASLAAGVMNNANQPASSANIYVTIIQPKVGNDKTSGFLRIPISKKSGKAANYICSANDAACSVSYVVNMNDTSCTNLSAAVSDVNVSLISTKVIAQLQNRASSCAANTNNNAAVNDLLNQDHGAVNDLLGNGQNGVNGVNGAAGGGAAMNNNNDAVVDPGCWGNGCKAKAGQPD